MSDIHSSGKGVVATELPMKDSPFYVGNMSYWQVCFRKDKAYMRIEQQQNINIVDLIQQGAAAGQEAGKVTSTGKKEKTESTSSFNVKDVTYLKPGTEEKKSMEEELEEASVMDARERKNQMTVLSHTTSGEDYAKMQEDGFALDSTTGNTIVTETDKIKAQLAKAGVDISIFGDDLDLEQLEAITGSTELAMQLASAMQEADLPLTEENLQDAVDALQLAGTIQQPNQSAAKYLIDNELAPTIENLYLAGYSGDVQHMPDGEAINFDDFAEQMDAVIRQAGYTVNEQTVEDAKWLIENEVAYTPENFEYYEALMEMSFPISQDKLLSAITNAVAEGKRPQDALLLEGKQPAIQAEHAMQVVNAATDEDVAYLVDHEQELNIHNLEQAVIQRAGSVDAALEMAADQNPVSASEAEEVVAAGEEGQTQYSERDLEILTAKRQLEETRLIMTVEANYALLKRGISIDTQPLEQLVEELKEQENQYYQQLLKAQGAEDSTENVAMFRETMEKVTDIQSVPAYVLGIQEVDVNTINTVHKAGTELRDTFERANERYETLMTAPRADLGDSISKAFRNVDDILTDLNLDTTEANQRAVRILAYNELDITPEAIARMKLADEEVQRVFKNMTPAVVTQMIKEGVNPLDMDFASLNEVAEQMGEQQGESDARKFGEFLWKMEQNDGITEEERESYIGIYRLIHQVEGTDGAAIGALVNQGTELTMRNLMMAVRSERRSGKIDYSIDEDFGEVRGNHYQGTSITEQIEAAYQNQCLKDVAESMTPEKLRGLMEQKPDWADMTPEQLKEALETAGEEENIDRAYIDEQLAELSESANVSEDIYAVLEKYDIPNTVSYIRALDALAGNRNQIYRKIFGENTADADDTESEDAVQQIKNELLDDFIDALSSPKALGEVQERLGEVAENVMKGVLSKDGVTSLDVREMRMLSAQLSVTGYMAKQEQYSVPVKVSDGVVNVSLKIVRGVDKKGVVDITMESSLRGKIAATFQAKENGISGLIATDDSETEELLQEKSEKLVELLGEDEEMDIHYAHLQELDLRQFSNGLFGVDAADEVSQGENSEVQTTRLYHIAESFIRVIRDTI
jgi:hypothetical protein